MSTKILENESVPHIFSARINKRDISTICWHTQLLLEEFEERFAIPFVRLLINVVKAILYTQYISSSSACDNSSVRTWTYNTQVDCGIKGTGKSEGLVVGDYNTDVRLWFGKNFSANLIFRNYRFEAFEKSSGDFDSSMRTLENSRAKSLSSVIYGVACR